MAKGKGINLTPREQKKKPDKYSEISDIKNKSKFEVSDQKLIFIGLSQDYRGLECKIIKRNKRKDVDYYRVKFDDSNEIGDITDNFLKTFEEYELWLLEQDKANNENKQSDMSEFEIELNKQGIDSYHNYVQCLSPIIFYERKCTECGYEKRCVYGEKYKYKKLT